MQRNAAFSLLEFLTYLALLFMYTLYVFQFLTHMHCAIKKNTAHYDEAVRRALFFDALRRDVRCASSVPGEWDSEHTVFVQYGLEQDHKPVRRCVGYRVHEGHVQRLHGEYNFTTRTWVKKTAAMIGNEVTALSTKLIGNERVKAVELKVILNEPRSEHVIRVILRNCYV